MIWDAYIQLYIFLVFSRNSSCIYFTCTKFITYLERLYLLITYVNFYFKVMRTRRFTSVTMINAQDPRVTFPVDLRRTTHFLVLNRAVVEDFE